MSEAATAPPDAPTKDIVSTHSPVTIGLGWSPPGTGYGSPYREAETGSLILLLQPNDSMYAIALDLDVVEPDAQCRVSLVSSAGATLSSINVIARQIMRVVVPAKRSDVAELHLSLDPLTGPARIRVHSLSAHEVQPDVVLGRRNMELGQRGWHALEASAGEMFRWVDNNAEIRFLPAFKTKGLLLDVAPGPSVVTGPLELFVFDDAGQPLTTVKFDGRTKVAVDLRDPGIRGIRLHIANGGRAVEHDSRILNLQVFGVALRDV